MYAWLFIGFNSGILKHKDTFMKQTSINVLWSFNLNYDEKL